jgi:hypothetical protein
MPTATKAQAEAQEAEDLDELDAQDAQGPDGPVDGEWCAPLSWDMAKAVASGRLKAPMPEDFNGPGFAPAEPCKHRPGTEGKIAALAERYARRQALFHPGDAR